MRVFLLLALLLSLVLSCLWSAVVGIEQPRAGEIVAVGLAGIVRYAR